MTENGNHGGSSYEETDSLALFIGLGNNVSGFIKNTVHQVSMIFIYLFFMSKLLSR